MTGPSATDPSAADPSAIGMRAVLSILGTSDLHGHARSHDYHHDHHHDDHHHESHPERPPAQPRGLARVATLIEQVRTGRPPGSVVVLDVGDTIQGTPLVREGLVPGEPNPMAVALNLIGCQAAAVGNHDLDRGPAALHDYANGCDFPLLAANIRAGSEPLLRPWTILDAATDATGPVRVGVLGLTTPGTAVWDRDVLGGLDFDDIVASARTWVPRLRAAGAELVVVLSHSGLGPSSSYDPSLAAAENDTARLVAEVPGIDAVLLGHAHEVVATHLTCSATGRRVPAAEPGSYGSHLARIDLTVTRDERGVHVLDSAVEVIETASYAEHPRIVAAVEAGHARAREAMLEPVGESDRTLSLATATVEASPLIALINHVQARTIEQLAADTEYAGRRVVSVTAPVSRTAGLPAGTIRVGDVTACYPFDNTLVAVPMTGAELSAYLEHAAGYFRMPGSELITNAPRAHAPDGVPDYNYDIAGATDGRLTYALDIASPAGARLRDLRIDNRSVGPTDDLLVAMSSYRAAGGGAYPSTAHRTPVLREPRPTRTLLIDWLRAHSPVPVVGFSTPTWRLMTGGEPLRVC